MKRSRIIVLSILAALLLAAIVVVLRADRMAERMVSERLTQMSEEQQLPLSWSDIRIRLLHGSVRVDSLAVQLNIPDSVKSDTTCVDILVPRLDIGRIHWLTLLRRRVVRVDRIRIKEGSVALATRKDHTSLRLDSLMLAAYDIRYNLLDSSLTYNDSVYLLQAAHIDYTSADGLFAAAVGSLQTEDAGSIVLTDIAGGNTDKKEDHAVRMGKQEVTWARFRLSEVRTSPVNIIRMALAKEVSLDTVSINAQMTDIYYDTHFPPKEPYPMPQEALLAMKMPLQIKCMNATLGVLHLGMTSDGKHAGYLDLKKTNAHISNISNAPGSTMHTNLTTHIGGSTVHITTDMKMNKRGTLTYQAELANLTGRDLRPLSEPLLGVELNCNFHNITTKCEGDNESMHGTFCMRYDSLSLHVSDKGPVEELSKFAWLVNSFSSIVLYNRNPRSDHEEPVSFDVSATRDPMQPFPAYFIAVINDGILQTILPFGMGKGLMQKQKKK